MTALSLYLLTFNCARNLVQPAFFAPYLFQALPQDSHRADILVLCLQEVAPIGYAFLGGSFLSPYYNAFRQSVKLAAGDTSYVNVISRNVGMTAIMIFARNEIASDIAWLHTAGVGVGLAEMGNKGAVGVRIGYRTEEDIMPLTFVSAHLAPMEASVDRRLEDYQNIVQKLVFVSERDQKPIHTGEESEDAPLLQTPNLPSGEDNGGMYSGNSHLFFAGDLNYRTSILPPSPLDIQKFPQPSKHQDDPQHFSHLLADDQLSHLHKGRKTLQGLEEVPISFPPTYKYKNEPDKPVIVDGDQQWKWATHRWPSWCDRIFYSLSESNRVEPQIYKALPLFSTSDHRPVALSLLVPKGRVSGNPQSPYKHDPEWKTKRQAARKKEIVVGLFAYLALTWEGNGLLLASVVGALGGYLIIRSMLIGGGTIT